MQISSVGNPVISHIIVTAVRYGFPKYVGVTPVEAVTNAAIAPLSGMKPSSVGQLKSGWVERYSAPFLTSRQAVSSFL